MYHSTHMKTKSSTLYDHEIHDLDVAPDIFRAILKERGWTITEFARGLGLTRTWVTRVIDDVSRSRSYTEALWALPDKKNVKRELAARQKLIERLKSSVKKSGPLKSLSKPGFRYRVYLPVGAVVQASSAVGSIAEEGERGIVFDVKGTDFMDSYGIIFESGGFDYFNPDDIDAMVVSIGIERNDLLRYLYKSDIDLISDFNKGIFDFW